MITFRRTAALGSLSKISVLISGSVGSAVFSFGTQVLCARSMLVADYGQLVALIAIVNIFSVFSGYGVGWYWLQLFGREGPFAYRWIAPTIRLLALTCTAGAVLLGFYVLWGRYGDPWLLIALLAPILFSQALTETTISRFQLEERYTALAFWQSAMQTGRFVVSILLISYNLVDLHHFLIGYVIISLMMIGFSIISLRHMWRQQIKLAGYHSVPEVVAVPPVSLRTALTGSTPYCFCTIFYLIYTSGVVAIVERMLGGDAAAVYNTAYLLISAIYLIPGVIYMKYLVGKIFRWSVHDTEMFSTVIHIGVGIGFAIGFSAMIIVMGLAGSVIPLLFGARYDAAVSILMLLAIGIPVRFVQHAYGAALFSQENMKRKVWCLGGAACICLLLSVILVPLLGIPGAALASVGSEFALLGFFMYGVNRYVEAVDLRSSLSIRSLGQALARIERRAGHGVASAS